MQVEIARGRSEFQKEDIVLHWMIQMLMSPHEPVQRRGDTLMMDQAQTRKQEEKLVESCPLRPLWNA